MHSKLLDRIVKKCERAVRMRKHLPASWQLANVCFVCRGVQVEIVETSLYRNMFVGGFSLYYLLVRHSNFHRKSMVNKRSNFYGIARFSMKILYTDASRGKGFAKSKSSFCFSPNILFIARDVDVESISYLYIKFLSKNTPLPNILALYVYFCRQCYKSRI